MEEGIETIIVGEERLKIYTQWCTERVLDTRYHATKPEADLCARNCSSLWSSIYCSF